MKRGQPKLSHFYTMRQRCEHKSNAHCSHSALTNLPVSPAGLELNEPGGEDSGKASSADDAVI